MPINWTISSPKHICGNSNMAQVCQQFDQPNGCTESLTINHSLLRNFNSKKQRLLTSSGSLLHNRGEDELETLGSTPFESELQFGKLTLADSRVQNKRLDRFVWIVGEVSLLVLFKIPHPSHTPLPGHTPPPIARRWLYIAHRAPRPSDHATHPLRSFKWIGVFFLSERGFGEEKNAIFDFCKIAFSFYSKFFWTKMPLFRLPEKSHPCRLASSSLFWVLHIFI